MAKGAARARGMDRKPLYQQLFPGIMTIAVADITISSREMVIAGALVGVRY